jgi:hypothetical protein
MLPTSPPNKRINGGAASAILKPVDERRLSAARWGCGLNRVAGHIFLPAMAPLAIVALYFTPVALVGCVNRGIAALVVVLLSLIAGIVVAIIGVRAQRRNDGAAVWWIVSACILLVPTMLVLGPLG